MTLVDVECFPWIADKLCNFCTLGSQNVGPKKALRGYNVVGEEPEPKLGKWLITVGKVGE